MKKLILGLVVGLMLGCATGVIASSNLVASKATFKVLVNGNELKTDKDIVAINGSTYLPLKAIGEALGVRVNWNGKKRQVEIGEVKDASKYNFNNPAPIGVKQILTVSDYFDNYSAEVTINEILSGDNALSLIKETNKFNDDPKEGNHYVLAKVKFKLITNKDGKALNVNNSMFKLYSSKGASYENVYMVIPEPKFDSTLYAGAEHEGWVVFEGKFNDLTPKIGIGQDYEGAGGLWFQAYSK